MNLLFVTTLVGLVALGCAEVVQLSPANKQALVNAHNDERQLFGLQNVTWSDDIANVAASWAETCNFGHSSGDNRYPGAGENVYMTMSTNDITVNDKKLKGAVDNWNAEKPHYILSGVACIPKKCGHWSQVVWKCTDQIGCAASQCGPYDRYSHSLIVVCQYLVAGNMRMEGEDFPEPDKAPCSAAK